MIWCRLILVELKLYFSQDRLADLLLQQRADPLHLCGHAGRPVDVSARRMVEAPLLLCELSGKRRLQKTARAASDRRRFEIKCKLIKRQKIKKESHSQGCRVRRSTSPLVPHSTNAESKEAGGTGAQKAQRGAFPPEGLSPRTGNLSRN